MYVCDHALRPWHFNKFGKKGRWGSEVISVPSWLWLQQISDVFPSGESNLANSLNFIGRIQELRIVGPCAFGDKGLHWNESAAAENRLYDARIQPSRSMQFTRSQI